MAMHRCGIPFGLNSLLPYLQRHYGESLGTEILHQLGVCTQIVDVRFPDGACLQSCHELSLPVGSELFPEQYRVLSVEYLDIQIFTEGCLEAVGSQYLSHDGNGVSRSVITCCRSYENAKKSGDSDDDDGDHDEYAGEGYLNNKQFIDAVDIAVSQGQISTSLLQRKISIGFGKAAKFIDIMEDMGIVGEANGQRPREVKLTPDEWRERLARSSY